MISEENVVLYKKRRSEFAWRGGETGLRRCIPHLHEKEAFTFDEELLSTSISLTTHDPVPEMFQLKDGLLIMWFERRSDFHTITTRTSDRLCASHPAYHPHQTLLSRSSVSFRLYVIIWFGLDFCDVGVLLM